MYDRRLLCAFILTMLVGVATGCSGGSSTSGSGTAAPSASAAQTETPAAGEASSAASPQAAGTPVTVPTPTPDPNLLSTANGTVLRSYSPVGLDHMNDGSLGNAAEGVGSELPDDAKPPFIFTFELPGVTKIDSWTATLRGSADKAPPGNVEIAVSTSGPDSGFRDVGTMTADSSGDMRKTLAVAAEARWVRVTANQLFDSIGALGTLATPPPGINPTGIYIEDAIPDLNGGFVASGRIADDTRVRFVAVGSGLTATACTNRDFTATYVGQFQGRSWNASFVGNKDGNPATVRAVVNDDASIIAGVEGSSPVVFMRTTDKPSYCVPRVSGTGLHHVLVLDQDPPQPFYPADSDPPLAGYSFSAIAAGMLDASALSGQETIITRGVCNLSDWITPQQMALFLQWAAGGHKLILGGGACGNGSDFTYLPYPFTSAGPGPESTNASLIQVENSALGTNDKNDATHFVDTLAFVKSENAISSASPVTTTDPHWCGHFFAAKTTNLNGFIQTYASNAKDLMIYDGFDPADNGNPQLQHIRQLELALPVPSDLPCTQLATDPFVIEPSQEATFSAGTAAVIHAPMDVLANQGWNGHVTIQATGPLQTAVQPSTFDIAGGVVHLIASVKVPASTKAGVYTIDVVADNGSGKKAAASITLTGTATIKKAAVALHQRIRVYGIHFDYDSARIQPRSEPVIADIAALMRANPSWHFEVSGHTDSDGGAAYNLALSKRRAQSVVSDLVARYGVARSRLVAKGYGLTRPVASNATDAGKTLNRRVELERVQ